jgi:hypothetical protein
VTTFKIELEEFAARRFLAKIKEYDRMGIARPTGTEEIARQISAQLAPPRMDEPTEWASQVEAAAEWTEGRRYRFIRATTNPRRRFAWFAEDDALSEGQSRSTCWDDLIDPRPVKEDS